MLGLLSLANFLGFLSLLAYVLTLVPSIVRVLSKSLRRTSWAKWLAKKRRLVGIIAWVFGVAHGVIITWQRNLNLLDPDVAKHFFQGIIMITIFTILAATSNDASVKKLKGNWKKLHRLSYLVLLFLPWHILDKMGLDWERWTIWTPIGLGLLVVITYLFIWRWIEAWQAQKKRAAKKKARQKKSPSEENNSSTK
jgi:sulfoxide reductase heme-binding subunit YedZ